MQNLIDEILTTISQGYQPLTIVSNKDGFLSREDVLQALRRDSPAEVVVGNAIQLRVHYELNLRKNQQRQAIYIITSGEILPDISTKANMLSFKIADHFPNFIDKETLTRQPFEILSKLHDKHIQGRVSAERLQSLIDELTSATVAEPMDDFGDSIDNLKNIDNPDWSDVATIQRISDLFVNIVEAGRYDEITETIDNLNFDFQHYLDDTYWNSLNANPLLRPRCVNGIIQHIRNAYRKDQKVAMVVVDGLAFWQYSVLRRELENVQIHPKNEDWIYSWLPSITSFSRQAIFSGKYPTLDYTQSPNNERLAWQAHWPLGISQYQYDNGSETGGINTDCKRLAFVTVALDEKMHSSSSYADLLALTKIWAKSFAKQVKQLKDSGFDVILTTDHGNVLSKGWRPFTPTEKAHLYGKSSRGHRHAIFMNIEACDRFAKDLGYSISYIRKDLWFVSRDENSFNSTGKIEITHGGSHFFECMIPFIKY